VKRDDWAHARQWVSRTEPWLLLVLVGSAVWKLWNIGHSDLTYWDESFHAIVARNLLEHPLTFTLYDDAWLAFPFQDWVSAHIWLHKPPLAMWQIAASYALFGVNLVSLRLPSVLLSTAAAFLTYRIGHAAFGSKNLGLLAATLQALNPFLMGSIYGYHYSDHVDVALIFWIEVGIYALVRGVQTGRTWSYVLAGAGLGAAFLTKMFPALIVAGVAVALFLLKHWLMPVRASEWRIGLRHLSVMAAAAAIVALPWMIYAWAAHPAEFVHNVWEMLGHLTGNVEQWAASWDRFLFDYLLHQVPWVYTMILVALCYLTVRSLRGHLGDILVVLWAWGVLVPFSLAESKPYSGTLIAIPALLLGFARLLQLVVERRDTTALAIWAAVAAPNYVVPQGPSAVIGRGGLPPALRDSFAPYLMANGIVLQQLGAAALIVLILMLAKPRLSQSTWRRVQLGQVAVALVVTSVLAASYAAGGKEIVFRPQRAPVLRPLAEAIDRHLPDNAALIMDVTRPDSDPHTDGYHLALMFWSDRSVYRLGSQLADRDLAEVAAEIEMAGGLPLLVSDREIAAEPVLSLTDPSGFRVYPISVALTPDFTR
jgi:4-amino-4-deoxy-L-arabinose transferase-like glycosyltransferase